MSCAVATWRSRLETLAVLGRAGYGSMRLTSRSESRLYHHFLLACWLEATNGRSPPWWSDCNDTSFIRPHVCTRGRDFLV
jgi:hypothetical protein